ncbi:MAG: S-layer homology domain-containing protein [Hominilimicola sp.]|uniref:S-layer homology domain-containing protein n=1 Tax=Hominilimicola sp. TaxID=3073571 RepID=UPI00399503AA
MKFKTKGISLLLSIAMLLSMFPATSFALNLGNTEFIKPGTTEANMPEMKTVAVKVNSADNGYDIISGTDGKLTTPLEKDDTIIVAIQANNFDQFVQNSFGVQELSVALVYDTRYLEPTSTTNKKYITASKNFLAKDETNFMNQEIDGMYMVDTSTAKYAQDLASGETSILDSNTSNLKKAVLYVTCTPNSATDVNEQLGVITAGQLINFVEFKVKEVPDAGSKGVAITESSNLCLVMQNTGIFNKTWGGIDGLQEYMKINNSLNLFPAGAAKKTGISVKSGTMASTQFVGDVFKPGVDLQFDYSDGSHTDLGESDTVTYKYGAAGITAADNAGLTEIPATLTTDVNGKHIYAIVGNFICDLGELTVSEIKTTEITVSGAPTTAYDGTAINFNDLVATIKKNNGTSVSDLKFTNYENVSNGLAIYKSNAAGTVGTQVTASDKYAHGDNYFVVALKSDTTVKSAPFKVTSNYDDITISASTNNAAKTSYNKDDNFDPTGIVVKAKKASETTGADVAYDNFDSNYKVVIATSETEAKTATAVTASTKITEAMLDGNHKVYVVYTNAGSNTQSVVSVATLGAKKIKSATISGGKTAYTYGDKLKTDDLELNVTYDDNSTGKISYADLAAAGITVKIGETVVNADTVITLDMKDKTVDFIYDGKTTLTSSAKITVAAKTVYYTVSDATITKVYDGGLTIPADQTLPTISIKDSATAFVGTDSYTVTGTFAYTDKNVGTDKKIKLTTTLPETNGKYTFAPDTDKINADGTLKTAATITAKTLTVNADAIKVPAVKANPNATADVTADSSLVLTKDNSSIVEGDNVTLPFTYKYAANDVKTPGTPDVEVTEKALTGTDAANYSFTPATVTVKGSVTQEAFSDIEISGPAKVTYTYPDLTPDFGGLVVNAVYGTGASATKAPVTNYKLLDKDGNEFDKTAKLPYGDTTIKVSYTEGSVTKTKTVTLTAKKKPIKLSDIIFKPESKSYDGTTTATGTATVKDGVIVAGDTVNISAKWEFDGKDVGTNTIKVSDIKADNENYEIVGEDNLPVSSTTINNSTAVIKPATPENVTAKADKKTNNIVLSGTTADFEYSTDNGATWVKAAAGTTTIENAVRNKEYTILVRTAATTSAPASDAATVKATTYKYLVNIYKNGAAAGSEPEYKVYTNDEEINAVKDDTTFGKFNSNVLQYTPSRFRAYFTDSACTTSADVANLPKDSNDNINLYYTAKKSSGGGGSSVSIKLDKDTVSGVVGDKIKVTATVTGSTAKPTWTSSNEDVATVDENGNITFVGKGTATVKVKVNGIVKNIPVTVKEATATPVPTVKPTEAPVINTEYTKPYASGYDDGSFLPNNNITRGELAAMIARLSYGDDLPDGMYQASFPDVDSDAWFNKYIGYLEDKDVLSGYEDGTFRPMDTITRGEISAVIARAQRYDLISYNGIFTDVTENDWAKDYIETLADKNIVSGYEDGTFGPYSPLTRAEAVAIINRVLVESTPIVTFTPNDIAGHWAEADILLAVNERMVGANAVVPTVKPEETAAPEETVAPETTVTPEETVAPEKTTAPEATPAA